MTTCLIGPRASRQEFNRAGLRTRNAELPDRFSVAYDPGSHCCGIPIRYVRVRRRGLVQGSGSGSNGAHGSSFQIVRVLSSERLGRNNLQRPVCLDDRRLVGGPQRSSKTSVSTRPGRIGGYAITSASRETLFTRCSSVASELFMPFPGCGAPASPAVPALSPR
jgi:hypothetical protein